MWCLPRRSVWPGFAGAESVAIADLAEGAEVVFIGQPVHQQYSLLSSGTSYVVEVSALHRGNVPTEVLVDVGSTPCGNGSLLLDVDTVVFGSLDEDGVVQLSFATTESAFEQDMIERLGAGERPTEQVELSRATGLSITGLFGQTALRYVGMGLAGLALFTLLGKWVSGGAE